MLKKFIAAIIIIVSCGTLFSNKGEKTEAAYYDYHIRAIQVAENNMGVPYQYGGTSPYTGFDCSGFVKYSYAKAGKTLNRTASQMFYGNGYRVYSLHVGDLLFYGPTKYSAPTHVAIYIGNGKMIMSSSSKGVMITSIYNSYWHPRYIGAKRV